ncbi:Lrp/AsnC family transcriptional regulator [Haloferax sp. YSSS75]|uniref:DUF7845 domain-containing protein n=1 Tax=Haloferax sp. YSSS75 TaxID=3388564 RepID=UPI00398C994B
MSDEFEVFDATPVSTDDEDSVASHFESDGPVTADIDGREVTLKGRGGRDVDLDISSSRAKQRRRKRRERYRKQSRAQCRFCRQHFENSEDADGHECDARPVSACAFCGEEHNRREDPEEHIYTCSEFRRRHESELRRARAEVYRRDGLDAFDRFEYIRPWYHEFAGYLHYDCREHQNPLHSYYALNSLQKEHDWEEHGVLRTGFDVVAENLPQITQRQLCEAEEFGPNADIEKWAVEFTFESSGLATPNDDHAEELGWRLDDVREYRVKIYPATYTSHTEAKREGRKRASFHIKPRWPDIESKNPDAPNPSNPHDIVGFDVGVKGTNIQFKRYPDLFYRAMEALRDRQGFRFARPTRLRTDDFAANNIFKSSTVTDAELYVRVEKDTTGKVYAFDGTLHRISMLLGTERSGFAKSIRDDTKCPGYYHTATIDSMRASEIIGGHELAKELKHYHVKHPKAVQGGPLEHPKIGVSFQNSRHDDTIYWSDLERLERELDEAVLNVLRWSELPTSPDEEYFVADDYFQVTGDRRFRKVVDDQLPRLQEQQDRDARQFAVAGNLTHTDVDTVETLLTDGGVKSPADIAERIGVHISTVYNALERLGRLVVHQYGEVELASQYLAQQVLGKLKGARRAVEQSIEQSIDDLVRGEQFAWKSIDGDPWERWLADCVERIEEGDGMTPAKLILGWKPADVEDARELLLTGALRWAEVTGNDVVDFAREFSPVVETVDGSRIKWTWWSHFAQMLPGFRSRYVG